MELFTKAVLMKTGIPAPRARIVVRDAQWLVRNVEPTKSGGYMIHCRGLSDVVRDKEMQLLSRAEDLVEILDPATTRLVQDHSPYIINTKAQA